MVGGVVKTPKAIRPLPYKLSGFVSYGTGLRVYGLELLWLMVVFRV